MNAGPAMTATRDGLKICVIIAAYNSEQTIGRAIASALSQPEVSEVVVVDDRSTDATIAVASAIAVDDRRLTIIAQKRNAGPAAARNRAIDESSAPLIAILDADDYFLPNRFARLNDFENWDALADNIAFVPEALAASTEIVASNDDEAPQPIEVERFIDGNISRPGKQRGELGFIKPVISRAFLDTHGLRYDETMRLGEDYAVYLQMLLAGARFGMVRSCGYVAIERGSSLSGSHGSADLAALLAFDRALLASPGLSESQRAGISRHANHIAARHHHRHTLDVRQKAGRIGAAIAAARSPARLPALIGAIARDKLGRPPPPPQKVRYLFD